LSFPFKFIILYSMESARVFFLLTIFLLCIGFISSITAQEENLLPFYIYKGLHTGYAGIRTLLLYTAPLLDPAYSGWIYSYFDYECHQLPERSFYLNGRQLPLCARCTGIITGSFAGQLSYFLLKDFYFKTIFEEHNFLLAIGILVLGMVPLVVDGGVQLLADYESNNSMRLGTGLLFGFSFSLLVDTFFLNFNRLVNYANNSY